MEDNQKYNKRRRSYTEFRTSYSDNKDYFISTDQKSSYMPVLKYVIIAVVIAVLIFVGFIVTDALLNISETPYVHETTTVTQTHTDIDKKYFENIVTTKPDSSGETESSTTKPSYNNYEDENYNEYNDEDEDYNEYDEDYDEETDNDSE